MQTRHATAFAHFDNLCRDYHFWSWNRVTVWHATTLLQLMQCRANQPFLTVQTLRDILRNYDFASNLYSNYGQSLSDAYSQFCLSLVAMVLARSRKISAITNEMKQIHCNGFLGILNGKNHESTAPVRRQKQVWFPYRTVFLSRSAKWFKPIDTNGAVNSTISQLGGNDEQQTRNWKKT